MAVLVDTNILLRMLQPHTAHATIANRALDALHARNEELHIASQNLVEFCTVATRPLTANGLGFSVDRAMDELRTLKQLFTLLPELPLQNEWERLVTTYCVSGKSCHDARLVAAMTVHGTRSILTFNVQDFIRYADITVLDPRMIV
jgi:predicted nucleic acid-binding protein